MSSHVFATDTAACRAGCGACCIAPSITSYIPGMPNGKPAGVRCAQLSDDNLCRLFGDPSRPAVCERFDYDADVCGEHREEALATLNWLESTTR
ncbi:YkgJ family cysteine cluster protein [Halomonas sp. XH26]|uniref:YkgJ family cysteine cluster protein n=1 Tax=Vreelandella alkaliphila TaxID=272774 RepID=A0AAJ2VSD3_9GAMM|nr:MULTISPECIES: YkgJ family cysteine cluster protein [Halomonas]AYF35244.1 zinc/iron-chelating domain-containing protein [Halomonas alkaliphila]MDX5979529.1 YkgJ family cysteine cluster protein [Halomonas alkaliphila]UTA81408.1 YkgJ family cysteine cluster protein [Halomonas sp. XH26]